MSYTVLARRYRSVTFEDIVGQDPIARTLRNAIDANRTAHAYLFCGTRGVGKTSMARIFARELNNSDTLEQVKEIGEAILRGEDLDVIEIDGASNRGVQEARDLIAASGLSPTRCPYRIYIIDEVHMLTTPAFNALLKTMEEPPPHVKFILCTTEPHKVPATIQSRCQRFDFKAIPSIKIANHLTFILKQEKIEADAAVIAEIARLGNGSMRDALSILDRLLSAGGNKIKVDEMEDLLGLPSQTAITQLCDAIAESNLKVAFESSDSLLSSGISLDRILEVVAMTFRNALLLKVCGESTELVDVSEESKSSLISITTRLDEPAMTHLIALCDATSRQVRRGGSGRALFDATIARLCLHSEIVEAGGVLSLNQSATKIKKKSKVPNRNSNIVVPEVPEELAKEPTPSTVTWDLIQNTLQSTPGLIKIAQYLRLVSLEEGRLVVNVDESGKDSSNYILGQRQRIEQILTKTFSQKFKVVIEAKPISSQDSVNADAKEAVQDDELVQHARGLFNGTIVQVKRVESEDS